MLSVYPTPIWGEASPAVQIPKKPDIPLVCGYCGNEVEFSYSSKAGAGLHCTCFAGNTPCFEVIAETIGVFSLKIKAVWNGLAGSPTLEDALAVAAALPARTPVRNIRIRVRTLRDAAFSPSVEACVDVGRKP